MRRIPVTVSRDQCSTARDEQYRSREPGIPIVPAMGRRDVTFAQDVECHPGPLHLDAVLKDVVNLLRRQIALRDTEPRVRRHCSFRHVVSPSPLGLCSLFD